MASDADLFSIASGWIFIFSRICFISEIPMCCYVYQKKNLLPINSVYILAAPKFE